MSAFEYQLSRSSRRKTLSIVVRRGKVKILAPALLPAALIHKFIALKTGWVLEKLQSQQGWAEQETQAKKQFIDGETFLYRGTEYPLQISPGAKSSVELVNGKLFVCVSNRVKSDNFEASVKKLLQGWYKQQITDYLSHRLAYFCDRMRVKHTSLKVRSYKRRWGSCSAKGEVTFNYLLMMAPDWVTDYVIVHELCHLTHLNHSPRFWSEVKRYYPEHKTASNWLRDNGPTLTL
ncbi:MAG: putative metal-dependent hydrolase [Phenylobacterium sp.]|jgi:predicted metal-dependent hydrolase